MRQKVICFDLDDTLYKEREFQLSGFHKVAEFIEQRTGKHDVLKSMITLLREKKNVFRELETDIKGAVSVDEMLKIYREHKPSIHLDTGAEKLLDTLKERGCILGIITDGRSLTQRNKIQALHLDRWFADDNVIISEEFGSEKPDKRNYRIFQERYPGCRYYYVGDNAEKDFITPNRLGWDTYGLRDVFGTNIHDGILENDEEEKRPKHLVDQLYSLINKIVPAEGEPFIVPIMVDCADESTQIGTGVILDGFLLTASHIFHKDNYTKLQYLFDNRVFTIAFEDAAFDGARDEVKDGYSKDLLIFKVSHSGSPFTLNTKAIDYSLTYKSRSYFYAFDKMHVNLNDRIKILPEEGRFGNCLMFKSPFAFYPGNSGCPIYHDSIVYGILWKAYYYLGDCRYEFVDARYIYEVLSRIQ